MTGHSPTGRSGVGGAGPQDNGGAGPHDMTTHLRSQLEAVRRGTRLRLGIWSAALVLLVAGLCYFLSWADGYVQYPSWLGQLVQEEAYHRLPTALDTLEREASDSSADTARKLSRETLRAIPRARRNSQKIGMRYATALLKKTDQNTGPMIESITAKHGALFKKYLAKPDSEELENQLAEMLAAEIPIFIENLAVEEPRFETVDLLEAAANKLGELEQNPSPSLEEELERELLALVGTLLGDPAL